MGAIKNNTDLFFQRHAEAFDQGESFGRHAREQELLPLLKAMSHLLSSYWPNTVVGSELDEVISEIENPPAPETTTTTPPTDDESVNF